MTLGSVKTLIGTELAARLQALELPGIGLYYDTIPSGHERLVVRFWFPVYGTQGRGYDGDTIERPTVQVDARLLVARAPLVPIPLSGSGTR